MLNNIYLITGIIAAVIIVFVGIFQIREFITKKKKTKDLIIKPTDEQIERFRMPIILPLGVIIIILLFLHSKGCKISDIFPFVFNK